MQAYLKKNRQQKNYVLLKIKCLNVAFFILSIFVFRFKKKDLSFNLCNSE